MGADHSEITKLMYAVPAMMALVEGKFAGAAAGRAALSLLDHAPDPALILDPDFTVLHANDAAQTLLSLAGLTRPFNGGLALPPVLRAAVAWHVGPFHPHAQRIVSGTKDRKFLVSVHFIPGQVADFTGRKGARYALTIRPLDRPGGALNWPLIQAHYRLTASEVRLAEVLIQGIAPRAAANRLGVGYETARSHLKSIYRKTGTASQAQLASILLRQFEDVFRLA